MIYTVTLNPALDYFMEYDDVIQGDVNRTSTVRALPGGKGIMESRMLNRLKVDNTALGFTGGFTGKFIEDFLEKEGSKTDFTPVNADSRINVKVKTATSETSLDAAGPHLTDEDVKKFIIKFDKLTADDIVVFAGTSPASLGEHFYEQLIREVKSYGAQFAMDVDGQKLLASLAQKPLIIKPNRDELAEIYGVSFAKKEDIIPYGKKMLEAGAQNVMVSMAGDGALLFTGDQVYFAEPVKGIIKNSVGAGDSTVAGFLAEWSKTADPVKAFKQGVACGTAKVFSEDMPSPAFIQKCFDEINIKVISD